MDKGTGLLEYQLQVGGVDVMYKVLQPAAGGLRHKNTVLTTDSVDSKDSVGNVQ